MAITVANLIAQVGADLTQFRTGMNEVEARLHQVDVREQGTSQRLSAMAAQAMKLDALSAQASLKRLEAMQKGTSFSRAADEVKAQRTAMQGGDSDRIRKANQLLAQRQSMDLAPLIQKARAADAALTAAVEHQQEMRKLLQFTTEAGVEKDIKLVEGELKKATSAYTNAAANFKKANADLESHAAKATSLSAAENTERQKAAKEIQALSRQEDELRHKHQAYLDTLQGRAGTLKDASKSVIARMPHIQAADEARNAVEEARAANMAQDAFEHRVRAANAIASASEKIGLGTIAALGGATKVGADFDQMLLREQHNTTLTAVGINQMSDAIKRLGAESGAPLDELAKGFRRASDLGFDVAQATEIVTAAMKASVATGSDLGETTALLSRAMKEYNIPARYAAQTMNLLVETSRRSALSMGELVHASGQVNAIAANMGLSFLEVQAAMITYTRHGLDASQASVQLRNDISKIISPSKQVQTMLYNLRDASKAAGVDLEKDFTAAGLRAKGLTGIWEDLVKVAAKYKGGVNPVDLAVKAFPNQRGTLGASIATGTGFVEYGQQMEQLRQKARDGVNINAEYNQSLGQINQQLARIKNSLTIASSAFSAAFAPTIEQAANQVLGLTKAFNSLPQPIKTSIANATVLGGAFLVAAGLAGKLAVGIASLNNALMVNTGVGLAGTLGPMLPAIAAITLVVGALGLMVVAANRAKYANEHMGEAAIAAAQSHATQARAAFESSQQTANLSREYDKVARTAGNSATAHKRMQELLDQIGHMSPDLVTGWDAQGHAIGRVADATQVAVDRMMALAQASRTAQLAVMDVQISQQQAAYSQTIDRNRVLSQNLTSHTLDQSGQLQREMTGVNLGGVWRPATQVEIDSHAPGLKKMPRYTNPLQFIDPRSIWNMYRNLTPDGYNYSMPGRTPTMAPNDPHMAAAAAEQTQIQARLAEQSAQLRQSAMSRAQLARQPLIPHIQIDKNDPFGANKYPAPPGADPTAGLYDKQKKTKSKRQSDAEKLEDSYFERMKAMEQGRFLAEHQGHQGDAEWETQAHGYVVVGNEVRKVTGDFYGLSASMKSAFVQSAMLSDKLELQKRISQDLASTMRNASRDQWLAQGKRTESEKDDYDYQHEMGAYAIDPNETNPVRLKALRDASRAKHGMNAQTIGIQESVEAKKDIEELKKEISRPLEGGADPWIANYMEMLKRIRESKLAYIRVGEMGAQKMALEYADNIKNADATKTYAQAMADANKELARYTEKDDDLRRVSNVQAQTLELAKSQYKDLTAEQKKNIIATYAQVDAAVRKLTIDKEANAVLKDTQKQMHSAASTLEMLKDPKQGRWQEYIDKIREMSPETFKDPMSATKATNKASMDFDKLESMREETEARQGIADVMEQVKRKSKELSTQYKMEVGDIRITRQQWDLLTDAEKRNIQQLDKMEKVKDVMHQVMGGLHDIISSALDDVHEHGFKNFFSNVLKDFDDLIWQIGKKWAMAQIDKLITGALGGVGGGSGNANPWSEAINVAGGIGGVIAGAAIGAPMSYGETRVVGENGPELFTAGRAGAVLNTRDSHRVLSGGYGGGTVVNMTVNTPDARGLVNSAHQITQDIGRKMNAARRRG